MATATNLAVMSASTLSGDKVRNRKNEDLGKLEDIMLDVDTGNIAYGVLSFGGLLGMGDKLFAIPWQQLEVDTVNKCLILNVEKETLENAPGFDKNNWPNFADRKWGATIYEHYRATPYWT